MFCNRFSCGNYASFEPVIYDNSIRWYIIYHTSKGECSFAMIRLLRIRLVSLTQFFFGYLWYFLLIVSVFSSTQILANYEDLSKWKEQNPNSNGTWSAPYNSSNAKVYQSVNGSPSYWVSPTTFIGGEVSGYFKLHSSGGDNDDVGFIIGATGGCASAQSYQTCNTFIRFAWNAGGISPKGFSLTYYNGGTIQHSIKYGNVASGVTVLPNTNTLDDYWSHNTKYTFRCDYKRDKIIVEVKNGTSRIIQIEAPASVFGLTEFPAGVFGFYNYSQRNVEYGNFTPIPPSITGSSEITKYEIGMPAELVDDTAVVGGGSAAGIIIEIVNNYHTGDKLSYTIPSGSGISLSSSTDKYLEFVGVSTGAHYTNLVKSIKFLASSGVGDDKKRDIKFTLKISNTEPYNGHYYEFISGSYEFWQALADAETRKLFGMQGYLATISTIGENNFAADKLSATGFIGISDGNPSTQKFDNWSGEGTWKFVSGPENGQTANFKNWAPGEPNNCCGGENYVQIYSASGSRGTWNDIFPGRLMGYVVEYGGMSGDPVLQTEFIKKIKVEQSGNPIWMGTIF